MKLGAITNSWRDKLDGGADIATLIDADTAADSPEIASLNAMMASAAAD